MPVEFTLRLDHKKIGKTAERYAYGDDNEVIAIGEVARDRGHLTLEELVTIGEWKSPRIRPHILKNDAESVEEITRFALSARSERARVEGLTILTGVGWPMASVILHFCHKDRYPILDFRAVWSVGAEEPSSWNLRFWLDYTAYCRRLAEEAGVSMRTLDQALWQWSKEKQGRE